ALGRWLGLGMVRRRQHAEDDHDRIPARRHGLSCARRVERPCRRRGLCVAEAPMSASASAPAVRRTESWPTEASAALLPHGFPSTRGLRSSDETAGGTRTSRRAINAYHSLV